MNLKYSKNNIINLEQENKSYQTKTINKKKNEYEENSSNTFFSKIFNSVSKIGQNLKNIMSMRINYEEDNNDNYNQNIYEQVSNRFNTNEEISLIDAPSFIEESYIIKKYPKTQELNNDNSSNKMIISQNEIKRDDYEINSFNKDIENKENIINTDIFETKDRKVEIKTSLLSKKREREIIPDSIFEEEKNNENKIDDEMEGNEELKNSILLESPNTSKEKSFYSSRNNIPNKNISNMKETKNKKNKTFEMNLSMKSIDNIKSEINRRREENLRNVEEIHKRYGLNYDYLKEAEMREKILEEYYKSKAKRVVEEKLEMEKKRNKRNEDFQKLKIKKGTGLKYVSLQKKPNILKEVKNEQIQFSGKPINLKQNENESSNLNIALGNKNNIFGKETKINTDEKKTDNKNSNELNNKSNISLFTNDNNIKINEDKRNVNENEKPKNSFDKEKISIFGEQKTQNKKSLFSGETTTENIIFGVRSSQSPFGQNLINISNSENKNQEKNNVNDRKEQNKETSQLFKQINSSSGNGQVKNIFTGNTGQEKNIFTGNNDSQFSFFNINNNSNAKNIFGENSFQRKEGCFDQSNAVDRSMNSVSLFTSNIESNNNRKAHIDNQLNNPNNPFLNNSQSNPIKGPFGNNQQSENGNQSEQIANIFENKNQPTLSLFGNKDGGNSLFGNKGLFG